MARASLSLVLVALAVVVGACTSQAPTRQGPSSPTYTTSLADVQDKVEAIAQDSCTTRSAIEVYPNCARYVAEVGNAALAAQSATTGVAGTDALRSTASRLADEVGQFSRVGCVTTPGVAGPPAQTCGDLMRRIQLDLTALRTQIAATPRPTTASAPTS